MKQWIDKKMKFKQLKIKYGKLALVLFLTILIWVWADLAQTENFAVSGATINIAKTMGPGLLVNFSGQQSVSIDKIIFRGPASRVADIKRRLNEGSLAFEFFLDVQQQAMASAGEHILDIAGFLKRSDQIKQLGLTVELCEPDKVAVNIISLEKKSFTVRCVDEYRNPVKIATVEPALVEIFAPADYSGQAEVQLTTLEIKQSAAAAITKTPYIELADGQIRRSSTTVEIATLAQQERLRAETIQNTTLGLILSANLQGKYKIEIVNLEAVISAVAIRSTAEAKRAYENMRYQVILEIDDNDKDIISIDEPLRKELIYNFPSEYIRKDEIILNQPPVVARFRLVPISKTDVPSANH